MTNEALIAQIVTSVLEQLEKEAGDKRFGKPNKMTLKLAKALIEKVEIEAARMGVNAVIAVSDEKARPVAVHCMDDAYIASYDIALNKTFTSVGLKMSTAKLGELAQPGGPLYGIAHTNEGKIVIFGGGEPLYIGDELIGAIGVSGGSAQQDSALAAYGKSVIKEVISCR